MKKIFINIKELIGVEEKNVKHTKKGDEINILNGIKNAYLITEGDSIVEFGTMSDLSSDLENYNVIDVDQKYILPTYADSHTHAVFAAPREGEFADRIRGLSYEEIAAKGGGILNSARKLRETDENQLFEDTKTRIESLIKLGTGAIEIKSGYGLSVEGELKMLRVIKRLKNELPIPVKATFLGAHAVPTEYKNNPNGYIDLLINEVLPVIGKEQLADYIDVFCETNYFSAEDTKRILEAGEKYGLKPKIHVNQFTSIGGIEVATNHSAVSVDHLEVMTAKDIDILAHSNTMATVLPSCSFFLSIPYAPVNELIEKGATVTLATDFNPGSSPSGNMNFVIALACIKMRMTPEQAINAATINGAAAMELENEIGTITVGKKANFIITKMINSLASIPYSFGENPIDSVYINGVKFE